MRPEQPEKAEFPILVTEFGIVMEVRPEQLLKAELPILVTPSRMVREESLDKPLKKPLGIFFIPKVAEAMLQQPSNTPSPTFVSESGIVIEVRPEHL